MERESERKTVRECKLKQYKSKLRIYTYTSMPKSKLLCVAFETIDRKLLLRKCEMYGIKGTALLWVGDYLSERLQVIKIESKTSSNVSVDDGEPQGGVLGPLLFIL
ncbi:unnamed protein product [Acanthoscelides obtectus]|uniref:Uncharacterized protein n=1 Tax=Acanthoscelides obtectus TaxID=200917 RepID=A0A9P0P4H6_ACAOB|nr:unnamed protein product [Acanthoscelides obtectus]CAK1629101.1 hypothetical protein AOBTE_LOCUS5578 [Acanthoscelides obtectus]